MKEWIPLLYKTGDYETMDATRMEANAMLHGLIDTHAHLDDPCFQDSVEALLLSERQKGVEFQQIPRSFFIVITLGGGYVR